MLDKTQMIPPDDPNRTQIGGAPTAWSSPEAGRTIMASNAASLVLDCLPERQYVYSGQSSRINILIRVTASGQASGARMPVNLCLILDRSGSMEGPPLEYVKRACSYVLDLLSPNDILSIVAFEDSAQVIMPARRIVNKALILQHINQLEVGNTTNLFEGIAIGASQVASTASPAYVNRALLFTDGEPTTGIKDFASIVGQVVEQKSRGITITALGFGSEYNEELLAAIAKRSGGNYYYIVRPELIPEVFRKEMETLMHTVARNVRLRIKLSKWAQLRQVHGKQPTFAPRAAEVTLSDLERGETQSAVLEFELGPRPAGKYRVARIEAIYDDAATGRTETVEAEVVMEFGIDAGLLSALPNPTVLGELNLAQASQDLERTMMGMRTQQVSATDAVCELEKTRMLLVDQGRTIKAGGVQQAIDQINQGAAAEKTIMGTIMNLDRDKTK